MTPNSMMDHITDYANEFGDQETLALFARWQQEKMGKKSPNVIKTLTQIQKKIHALDDGTKSLDYTIAITDAMTVILQEMVKL